MSALPFQGGVIFMTFVPDSGFGTYGHVDRHGHFTLKQLRLPVVNETHTKSYTRLVLARSFVRRFLSLSETMNGSVSPVYLLTLVVLDWLFGISLRCLWTPYSITPYIGIYSSPRHLFDTVNKRS
jgi:hypothetical protein